MLNVSERIPFSASQNILSNIFIRSEFSGETSQAIVEPRTSTLQPIDW